MVLLCLLLVPAADPVPDDLAKKMLPVYVKDASEYSIAVASDPKKVAELKKEPIFEWTNPTREGLQQGVVFVWLRDGRPAALASIFSQPHSKPAGRQLVHEFHAAGHRETARDPSQGVVERVEAGSRAGAEGVGRRARPGRHRPGPASSR